MVFDSYPLISDLFNYWICLLSNWKQNGRKSPKEMATKASSANLFIFYKRFQPKVWKLLPSLPPRLENPWLKAAAIFADMLGLLEAMLEDMLLEAGGKLFEDKSSSSTSSPDNHGPCEWVKFKKLGFYLWVGFLSRDILQLWLSVSVQRHLRKLIQVDILKCSWKRVWRKSGETWRNIRSGRFNLTRALITRNTHSAHFLNSCISPALFSSKHVFCQRNYFPK